MTGLPYLVKCEIAFDAAFVGSPTWVDVSSRLVAFSTSRGQQYDTDGPQPGTLSVTLDNTDGAFDPDNSTGPYYGSLLPNRRVRISAKQTSGSSLVYLAYGYVDSFTRSWPGGMAYSETVISCTDLTKYYARWTISGYVISQTSINTHMNAVAGYACSVGGTGLTIDADEYNGNQWDAITDLAIADGGRFFIGTDGNPVYQTSAYRTSQSVSTSSQATFVFGTPSTGIEAQTDLAPGVDDRLLANRITVRDAAGTAHVASHGASISQYGVLPFDLDTHLIAASANTRASNLRAYRAEARSRVPDFRIDALTDDDAMEQALTRQISDRVTLEIGGLGGGTAYAADYFIDSIAHDVVISGTPSWTTTYQVTGCLGAAVPVVTSGLVDDFNRPQNLTSLGTTPWGVAWQAINGTWGVVNGGTDGAAILQTPGVHAIAVVETGVADCTLTVDCFTAITSGGGLSWRVVDNDNHWFWDVDNSGGSIYKRVGGTLTQMLTGLTIADNHDLMEVVLSGPNMTFKVNGTTVGTLSDTDHETATMHGLRDYGGNMNLDDFTITY